MLSSLAIAVLLAGTVSPVPLPGGVVVLSSLPHFTIGGSGQPPGAPGFGLIAPNQSGFVC